MRKRIVIIAALIGAAYVFLIWRLNFIISDEKIISAAAGRGKFTVNVCRHNGYIYDRNMKPMVNNDSTYYALINPDTFDLEEVYPKIADMKKFNANAGGDAPFLCELDTGEVNDPMTPVIEVKKRYSENQPAMHIIGYSSENYGKCGVEGLYADFVSAHSVNTKVTYSINAMGNVLDGAEIEFDNGIEDSGGVVLSLDRDIQNICERAADKLDRCAVIVMDIKSGDILGAASRPVYDVYSLGDYIDRNDAPFVNRVFSGYSAGSVFKTVIAAAALEYGISEEFSMDCQGKIMIGTQQFNCHYWAGHGRIDMRRGMVESCNPYFIQLGRNIPDSFLEGFMAKCGFGSSFDLGGIISDAGYIPGEQELAVPAEKANLCFGQGMLSVTPLQVCRYICAVANGGIMPEPRLIYGTVNSSDEVIVPEPSCTRVMSEKTADLIKSFMYDTLYKDNSAGIPVNTDGGGKTSTAQTGRFDENGSEELTCWFAGFFPYDEPKYAIAVAADNGVSGNITCGPTFKEIAEGITEM